MTVCVTVAAQFPRTNLAHVVPNVCLKLGNMEGKRLYIESHIALCVVIPITLFE